MLEDFVHLDIEEDETSSHSREDRMRAAFEKSKISYAHEQVYTEPGVSTCASRIFSIVVFIKEQLLLVV